MAYITESALRSYGMVSEHVAKASRAEVRTATTPSVFLSHSHKDDALVRGAVMFLAGQGVTVYVDWLDNDMPEKTSPETALRIQNAIIVNTKFVLLATERSVLSRWVPWELGFADGKGKQRHMAIFPIKPDFGVIGSEYLGLYARIELGEGGTAQVLRPGEDRGPLLRDWLRS